MKFLVPNYSCLPEPLNRGYGPQIPVHSVLCPQLNLMNPPTTQFLGTPLIPRDLEGEGKPLKKRAASVAEERWHNGASVQGQKSCANDKCDPCGNNCKHRAERQENKHDIKKPFAFVLNFVPCIFYYTYSEQRNPQLIDSFIKLFFIQGESLARGHKLLSVTNYVIEIMTWKFIYTYRERCKTGPAHNRCWNWSLFPSKHTWMRFSKF